MNYYLITRHQSRGTGCVRTFEDKQQLEHAVVNLVNDGYSESIRALENYDYAGDKKYFSIVQGIAIKVKISGVKVK